MYISKINKKILVLFWICLQTTFSCAQILDADRVNKLDEGGKKGNLLLGLNFSADKQKNDLIDISNLLDYDRKVQHHHIFIFKGSYDCSLNGKEFIQNSGYFHFRLRDNDTRILTPEYFTQYQWNGLLGMKSRILFGSNARWMLINQDETNDLFIGFGIMYEKEKWNYAGVSSTENFIDKQDTVVNKFRFNQYIKCGFKINDDMDFVLTNFIQSDIKNIVEPRIASNILINLSLKKHLSTALSFESLYDFNPVVPIQKFYYSIKLQLNVVI